MSQKHSGAFFMGQGRAFPTPSGPWHQDPRGARRDLLNPVMLGLILPADPRRLGQASSPAPSAPAAGSEPMQLPMEVAREWADKVDAYMQQVQAIQDYVKAHPDEAAASGLAKDAVGLPPSGDIAAFPHLKIVYDKLRAGKEVTEAEMDLIPALGVALIAPSQKLAALQPSLVTPLNIAIGAGIVALAVGLVVL